MPSSILSGSQLFLASGSPRRLALLEQLGLAVTVVEAPVEEVALPKESPRSFVMRMAIEKALAGYNKVSGHDIWVVGADTLVMQDGDVFGKPRNHQQAKDFLHKLAGSSHKVLSAVAIVHQGEVLSDLSETMVSFANLDSQQIDNYLATDEWRGKAGGYAIQGKAAQFICHIDGSYSGVMGLPLYETSALLAELGFTVLQSTSLNNKEQKS